MTARTFTFAVQAASSFTPPASGTAVYASSTNTETSAGVLPASHSSANWVYSNFASYGGGALVPGYTTHGAYVLASTGGHNAPGNINALVYRFDNWTWERLDNANGVVGRSADYTVAETSGSPNYGLLSGSPAVVPAPAHNYRACVGVGGVFYRVVGMYLCTTLLSTARTHAFDCSTRLWSRYSANLSTNAAAPYAGNAESVALYDSTANRIWLMYPQLHGTNQIAYLDLSDATWKAVTAGYTADLGWSPDYILDDAGRQIFRFAAGTSVYRLNLSSPGSGWSVVSHSGTAVFTNTRWERNPVDGCFYTYLGTGNTLNKFDPTTRAFSTRVISGVSLPSYYDQGNGAKHHTRFFYVPSRACFAWIAGNNAQVVLLNP